ncbi:MAG TPA: hypothetical protein PKL13_02010, partial [bacterium]|nr:hypothetical protein [bacterium]
MYLNIAGNSISLYLIIFFIVIILVLFIIIFFVLNSIFKKQRFNSSFSMKLLKIRVPKFSKAGESEGNKEVRLQDIQEKIAIAENLYSTLGGMKAQRGMKSFLGERDDHFSFEIILQNGLI